MLLYNSRLKLFKGKLKSKWSGPFEVVHVASHGAIELKPIELKKMFIVNGQRVKHYYSGIVERKQVSIIFKDYLEEKYHAVILN